MTIGSRGDVAPFVGLGRAVAAAGHEVSLASHESFRGLIEDADLGFRHIPGDISPIISVPSTDSPPSPMFMRHRVTELTGYLRQAALATVDAATGADVLVVTGTAPFGYDVAEGIGIPSIGAYLQPYAPSAAYPPVLLNSTRSFGGPLNKALGSVAPSLTFPYTRAASAVRKALGLPRRGAWATRRHQDRSRWPVFHGFSPAVLPRPADWRPGLDICGYWWPEDNDSWASWQPPPELLDFLAAGPPPAVVTFGSMAAGSGRWLVDAVIGAVRHAEVRAVVQAGWAQLEVQADEQILPLGEAPHSWLFPRAAAVVHHGGAGTSGAVFRAGVPTVVTPIYADQPLWAARAHALGVGPKPIPFTRLNAENLAAALRSATTEPAYVSNARRLAEAVRVDAGAAPVIKQLEATRR